ncbi:WD40-repeat-containing domain protein [Suillus variegatus]|nr:WD40-repeat-containing domain protein [Suillus variegatus]
MSSDSETPAIPATEEAQLPTRPKKLAPKQEFVGHENYVWAFVFLHDNVHIVSGSWDGTMRKWDCNTGLLVGQPWKGEGGHIHALALSPDGKTITCGRIDGSVERWDTSGKMFEDVWTGHSLEVRSLSWSPNGDHIASGSRDGTILIRTQDNGKTEVGPIKTGQRWVNVLVYSPSGDRIASGGLNETICIWDTKTGELVVGPIEELGASVASLLWSSDNGKVYAASDKFVRVFDSNSGSELHRFEHNDLVNSIALSPKHNILACVGQPGVAQLWDTDSYKSLLHQPFVDRPTLRCISFSRDGRYLANSGLGKKLTLWVVKDIVPELTQETRPQSPTPSCLNVDATNPRSKGDAFTHGELDDSYRDDSQFYRPSAAFSRPPRRSRHRNPSSTRRFWDIIASFRRRSPANESTEPQHRSVIAKVVSYCQAQRRYASGRERRTPNIPLKPKPGAGTSHPPNSNSTQQATGAAQAQPAVSTSTALPDANTTPQTNPQVTINNAGCWTRFWLSLGCIPAEYTHDH